MAVGKQPLFYSFRVLLIHTHLLFLRFPCLILFFFFLESTRRWRIIVLNTGSDLVLVLVFSPIARQHFLNA